MVKNPPANARDARDTGLTPGLGRSPKEGNGNLLQYSCLENSKDRGACQAGYSQWGCQESDTTEHTCACTYTHTCVCAHTTHTHTLFHVTYKTNKWKLQSNKLRT